MAQSGTPEATPGRTKRIRWSLVALGLALAALVVGVPRKPPPPPSLAHPNEAFVDRVGIVSPEFARTWAGGLLNDDRAQIVVYVDARAPDEDLASWAIRTATDWKIGAAKDDTGLVVFAFVEPRIARIDVGYGLEDRLTDARVRQLLDTHLAPAFARGDYEAGFDALIFALREALGGDDAESIHARAAEARRRGDVPWHVQVATAFANVPRVVGGTVEAFREAGVAVRLPIAIATGVVLVLTAIGLAMAGNTLWRLGTLRATIRSREASGRGVAVAASLFEIVLGVFGFVVCIGAVMLVLLMADSLYTRKGSFSGAGAAIVWPSPPR